MCSAEGTSSLHSKNLTRKDTTKSRCPLSYSESLSSGTITCLNIHLKLFVYIRGAEQLRSMGNLVLCRGSYDVVMYCTTSMPVCVPVLVQIWVICSVQIGSIKFNWLLDFELSCVVIWFAISLVFRFSDGCVEGILNSLFVEDLNGRKHTWRKELLGFT
jgi:hypothetical protein